MPFKTSTEVFVCEEKENATAGPSSGGSFVTKMKSQNTVRKKSEAAYFAKSTSRQVENAKAAIVKFSESVCGGVLGEKNLNTNEIPLIGSASLDNATGSKKNAQSKGLKSNKSQASIVANAPASLAINAVVSNQRHPQAQGVKLHKK